MLQAFAIHSHTGIECMFIGIVGWKVHQPKQRRGLRASGLVDAEGCRRQGCQGEDRQSDVWVMEVGRE
jgi:hypothetical protein